MQHNFVLAPFQTNGGENIWETHDFKSLYKNAASLYSAVFDGSGVKEVVGLADGLADGLDDGSGVSVGWYVGPVGAGVGILM